MWRETAWVGLVVLGLAGAAAVAAQETDSNGQAIDGEALADDPSHGMGQGDPAIASGNDMHAVEGQDGFVGLDAEQQAEVELIEGALDWPPATLIGATIVDGGGKVVGEIVDLLIDGEMLVREVIVAVAGSDAASAEHVAVRLEDLEDAGGELVLDESVIGGDQMPEGQLMVQEGERWAPAEN